MLALVLDWWMVVNAPLTLTGCLAQPSGGLVEVNDIIESLDEVLGHGWVKHCEGDAVSVMRGSWGFVSLS